MTPKRGELRIHLGAAPGVGKTFAMLGEAHRRLERGTDVVAGVVETHGRVMTAELLEGIEVIPPRYIDYRGTRFPELDVPAVLARRPQVVLVDELAHTNIPGSRNAKRWQDVAELLDAGISVLSTVNVQHLESLNDVVGQITGIEQRETVPDEFVRAAEQIELVDITPEALRRRLSHGNVYAAERIDAALSNYFRPGNLTALRELALLWLADQVDTALAKYRSERDITDTWETRERVVVALTGGPESETLLRRASRIASKSSADLMALHVIRGDGLAGVSTARMAALRELAAGFAASFHTVAGDDVPTALLDFARQANATQLLVGTSRRSRWSRVLTESVGATVARQSGSIDVHLVTHQHADPVRRSTTRRPGRAVSWLAAVAVPSAICALTLTFLDSSLRISGETALFFVGVLAVALVGGAAPAAASAVLSGLLLNYFFAVPRHSLRIDEPDAAVTIVTLLLMAVAVGVVVDMAARGRREARQASKEAELLALFAGAVLRGADPESLLQRVRETYTQRAAALLQVTGEGVNVVAGVGDGIALSVQDADTAIDLGEDGLWLALSGPKLSARDRRVLAAVAHEAAGLVRRRELDDEVMRAESMERADGLRRALLAALSREVRGPLATARAAVDQPAVVSAALDRLAETFDHLLDSRLTDGELRVTVEPVGLGPALEDVLSGLSGSISDRVAVDVAGVCVLADRALLQRVLAGLLEAAAQCSPTGAVRVNAGRVGDRVLINVIDRGPARPAGNDPELAVARSFVAAMGGTVETADTPGGGTTVVIDLATGEQ